MSWCPLRPAPSTPQAPGGPTLTKQSLGQGLETWEIVEKFYRTGAQADHWNRREGRYGDFSSVGEYQDCLRRVLEAQEHFDALPSKVRDYVHNDPVRFLELAHDPSRVEELRGLGLLEPGGVSPPPPGAAPEPASVGSPPQVEGGSGGPPSSLP